MHGRWCFMAWFMDKRSDTSDGPPLPPRIRAAFDYLEHVRLVTLRWNISLPERELSALEKSVESAALRALQQYLLGEMDFAESSEAESKSSKPADTGDGPSPAPPPGCTP